MKKINVLIIALLFAATLICFPGCVTEQASLKIEKGLPQNKLAYYNDSFEKIREDLWEKAGYLYSEEQVENFKMADMRIENGKLIVKTKTGCFSKGGMSTKYAFRGDFDIQVDCHIDFLEGLHDMDHLIDLLVVDKSKELEATGFVKIGLYKRGTLYKSYIVSGYREKGKYHRGKVREIGNFHGTLRIFRSGNQISTLYKSEGDKAWKKMNTFRSTSKDVILGFKVQNFFPKRTYIKAKSPITAIFDNFRINAAHQIIEEDI